MIEIKTKEEFKKEVLEGDELVIVDFWAPWCGPCKLIAPIMEELEKEGAKVVKVNCDEALEIASEYGIRSIPTVMFFLYGEESGKMIGLNSKSTYDNMIKSFSEP